MRFGGWGVLLAACGAVAIAAACGGSGDSVGVANGGGDRTAGGGGGPPDAGSSGGIDAGTGGADAGSDAGTGSGADAGTDAGVTIVPPSLGAGWKFYTTADGLPSGSVMGASFDEGGTLWVAGGSSGLLALRNGTPPFARFGIADGLHPYGYLNGDTAKYYNVPDGSPADKSPSLSATPAISVAGGPAGVAFVGYQGKSGCEDAWTWQCDVRDCYARDASGRCTSWGPCQQASAPSTWGDPAVYKSGDADRVVLTGTGISVGHYDVFSGPNVVYDEAGGREKLCSILRIVYQHGTSNLWFGGNHGFALGNATQPPPPTCNGQIGCGVLEHVHPAFNDSLGHFVTDGYYGVAIDSLGTDPYRDVWFGGMTRTTRFKFGETGGNYFAAQAKTEDASMYRNRIDVWPDPVGEVDASGNPTYPTPQQWGGPTIDLVTGIASMADGTVWIGSNGHGLRHLDHDGNVLGDFTQLTAQNVSALAKGPDGSLWVGYKYGGGFSRIKGGTVQHFDWKVLGNLANSAVTDIQVATTPRAAVVISFQDGAVAVYTGQ